jgi:hypothetical protein
MIFDLLGIDKKLGIWICASIVSVSLLATTIIWAKTYYDVKADIVAVKEVVQKKKDAVGESFDRAEKVTRKTIGKTLGVFHELTPTGLMAALEAQRDHMMCVLREHVDPSMYLCGPHVFDTKSSCVGFKDWLLSVDWHGSNSYSCVSTEELKECEDIVGTKSSLVTCNKKELGEE